MEGDAGPNSYSPAWFEFFHFGISPARTEQESAFIQASCPLPTFPRLLDVCCGMGRHARALAACGYVVTGIERDERAVTIARERGGGPIYLQMDVRDYAPDPASFDIAIILSQSFGYFDPDTNCDLLTRLAKALCPGGCLVLDLWNPEFFLQRQGQRTLEMAAGRVQETTRIEDGVLFSCLQYPNGGHDLFEFQTFSPAEMARLAEPIGLHIRTACTDFSADVTPSSDKPRIQFVLERLPSGADQT